MPNYSQYTIEQLRAEYIEKSKALTIVKAEVDELFDLIVKADFGEKAKQAGSHQIDLGAGYKIKLAVSRRYSINASDDEVQKTIDLICRQENGELIANRLFKYSVSLSLTEYDQLPPKIVPLVDKIISKGTSKPKLDFINPVGIRS